MVFGWATLMLFGRVPQSKQLLLAGVSAGALLWILVLVGVAVPDAGTFMIAMVPAPDFMEDDWIRVGMLVLAVILPLVIGAGGLMLMDPADRPKAIGGKVVQVLRGYPYAAVLALVILFLLVVAPSFKVRTIAKRWDDAHIPIIVKPDGYEQVAAELEKAVDSAGLNLQRVRAPRVLEVPSRLLAVVGGESVRPLVPDRLVMLKAPSLEVTIHPSDVAVAGAKEAVARARAATPPGRAGPAARWGGRPGRSPGSRRPRRRRPRRQLATDPSPAWRLSRLARAVHCRIASITHRMGESR